MYYLSRRTKILNKTSKQKFYCISLIYYLLQPVSFYSQILSLAERLNYRFKRKQQRPLLKIISFMQSFTICSENREAMARLISYKVKDDDSDYTNLTDERAKELGDSSKKKLWRCLDCCSCCESSDTECDDNKDIEFALIKETKVLYSLIVKQIKLKRFH